MHTSSKYILHCPLLDKSRLETFVNKCLEEGASLIAVFGAGSAKLEDTIDEIVIGDGRDSSRFICTTSHPDETLAEVLLFVKNFEPDKVGKINEVRF